MNLQIINGCAGTNPELQTVGTDPGRQYQDTFLASKYTFNMYLNRASIHFTCI